MTADTIALASRAPGRPAAFPRLGTSAGLIRAGATAIESVVIVLAALLAGLAAAPATIFSALAIALTRPRGRRTARLTRRVAEDTQPVAMGLAVAVAVTVPFAADATETTIAGLGALALVLLSRATLARVTVRLRARGIGLEPAIIVGGGPIGVAIGSVLQGRSEYGLLPIGFVERDQVAAELPTLGHPNDLPHLLRHHGVRRIVIAFGGSREQELVDVLRDCDQLPFDFNLHVLPRFFELGVTNDGEADDLWGYPLVPIRRSGPNRSARQAKRAFDIAFSSLFLLAAAPVMAAIAWGVRRSSPGPILFRQERVGQYGQRFEILKFRSMQVNDDSDTQWSVDHDSRVTRIGAFLRRSHLDELPQLINVVRGDMALVGPRPERPVFVEQFAEEYRGYGERHRVPVGLTGWAQVNGLWGDTSMEARARFDNRYIEDWSFFRELVILLRTIPSLLGRRDDDEVVDLADDDAAPHAQPEERNGGSDDLELIA